MKKTGRTTIIVPPAPPHGPDDGRPMKNVNGTMWPLTDAEWDDYKAIQAGAATPRVPAQVPLWAARAALREAGFFDPIDTFVEANKATNGTLWEAWNMGNVVPRQGVIVTTFAPQFQLTDTALDTIFIRAAVIEAENTGGGAFQPE